MPKGVGYPKDEGSREFIGHKIKKLLGEGKKRSQAIAIALSMARARKKKA